LDIWGEKFSTVITTRYEKNIHDLYIKHEIERETLS